jgi:hypothetical protein
MAEKCKNTKSPKFPFLTWQASLKMVDLSRFILKNQNVFCKVAQNSMLYKAGIKEKNKKIEVTSFQKSWSKITENGF